MVVIRLNGWPLAEVVRLRGLAGTLLYSEADWIVNASVRHGWEDDVDASGLGLWAVEIGFWTWAGLGCFGFFFILFCILIFVTLLSFFKEVMINFFFL